MIKLATLLNEKYLVCKQGLLLNTPVKFVFTTTDEGSHLQIIERLFPEEFEKFKSNFIDAGYVENEDERDASYAAANKISKDKNIVRIVIENGAVYCNTSENYNITASQLKFLKSYCHTENLKLSVSTGRGYKEIEL